MDIFAKLKLNFKRARTFLSKGDINSVKAAVGYMETIALKMEQLMQQLDDDVFFDKRYKELEAKVPLFYFEVIYKQKNIEKEKKKKRDKEFHYCQNAQCPHDKREVGNSSETRKLYYKKDMYHDNKTGLMFCSKECYQALFEA